MEIDTQHYRKDLAQRVQHGYGAVKAGRPARRDVRAIRAILIHTTNNGKGNTNYVPEAIFLRDSPDVSAHYVVSSHDDTVVQLLPDEWIAWHAGACADSDYLNPTSLGIEIAWTVNKGPLLQQAIDNTSALVRSLLSRYPWITKIDTHRAQAIPRGRKIDPSGWDDAAFYAWRDAIVRPETPAPTPSEPLRLTDAATILCAPRTTADQCIAYMLSRPHDNYTDADIRDRVVPAYAALCADVGIDFLIAISQLIHETENLTSWWSARPRRNPAGLGVTGETRSAHLSPGRDWALAPDGLWHTGLSFATWADDAIPAHVGRLLAYAINPTSGTAAQRALAVKALAIRPLPSAMWGSSPILRTLGKAHNPTGNGWASPGDTYGAKIADIANAIRGVR